MSNLIIMYDFYASEYEKCWGSEYGQMCKLVARAYLREIERMVGEC